MGQVGTKVDRTTGSPFSDDTFIEHGDAGGAAVAPANKGRIRYNATTQTWEVSVNGGPWTPFPGGSGPNPIIKEVHALTGAGVFQSGIGNNGFGFSTYTWNFSDGVTDYQGLEAVKIPQEWDNTQNVSLKVLWRAIAGNAGNVRWQLRFGTGYTGWAGSASGSSPVQVTTASNGFNFVESSLVIPAAALTRGNLLTLRLERLGADAADTLADEAGAAAFILEFPS